MEREPQALTRSLRRPSWRNPRLGVGVLLMASSVALGAWTVSGASHTTPAYAALGTLTAGQQVGPGDLRVVEVNIDGDTGPYLTPTNGEPAGIALRTIEAGELVPAGALAASGSLDVRPVVLDIAGSLPAAVHRGAVADLWSAPRPSIGVAGAQPEAPRVVAAGLDVVGVTDSSSISTGSGTTAVEVLVPADVLGPVLDARASGGDLVLVPVITVAGEQAPTGPVDPGDDAAPGTDGVGAELLGPDEP